MRHFLNGIEISPRNRDSIGVVSDFTGSPDVLSLNVDSVILPREAGAIIKNWIQTNGLFLTIPYRVEMDGGITLDYYIDLSDSSNKPTVRQHEVEVKLKKENGQDDFRSRANGTSFELIVKQKGSSYFQTKKVPYFVVKDNVAETALSISITLFIMVREAIDAALKLAEAARDLAGATTPQGIVQAAIMFAARLAYFAALAVAIIQLAAQLFKLIFPIKRYFKGVYYKELFSKSCQYLGYNFSSTILSNNPGWMILPVPLMKNTGQSIFQSILNDLIGDFNKGYPTASDTIGLFGDFITELENQFNAKIFIIGNTVHFERRDWLQNISTTPIDPALSIQADRDDAFTYNTEDVWRRYYIHYQTDFSDLHTCEGKAYEIHDAEYSCENILPIPTGSKSIIKGLNEVSINLAVGASKDELSYIEEAFKRVALAIDLITNLITFGNGTNYYNQINNRKDALKISQQYFSITKSIYVRPDGNDKVLLDTPKYDTHYSAKALWDKFHSINQIQNNSYIIKENVRTRIRQQDFVNLQSNNFVLINGNPVEILKIEWIDEKSDAIITYKELTNWASGKVNTITVNA
jgi:hypothetical protein